jgi:hypothetical protein
MNTPLKDTMFKSIFYTPRFNEEFHESVLKINDKNYKL